MKILIVNSCGPYKNGHVYDAEERKDGSYVNDMWLYESDKLMEHVKVWDFAALHRELWGWVYENKTLKGNWPRWKENGGDVDIGSRCFPCKVNKIMGVSGCNGCSLGWNNCEGGFYSEYLTKDYNAAKKIRDAVWNGPKEFVFWREDWWVLEDVKTELLKKGKDVLHMDRQVKKGETKMTEYLFKNSFGLDTLFNVLKLNECDEAKEAFGEFAAYIQDQGWSISAYIRNQQQLNDLIKYLQDYCNQYWIDWLIENGFIKKKSKEIFRIGDQVMINTHKCLISIVGNDNIAFIDRSGCRVDSTNHKIENYYHITADEIPLLNTAVKVTK